MNRPIRPGWITASAVFLILAALTIVCMYAQAIASVTAGPVTVTTYQRQHVNSFALAMNSGGTVAVPFTVDEPTDSISIKPGTPSFSAGTTFKLYDAAGNELLGDGAGIVFATTTGPKVTQLYRNAQYGITSTLGAHTMVISGNTKNGAVADVEWVTWK